MKKNLKRKLSATAIGSVPYTDARKACSKILSIYRDVPFWPQMPKRTFFENMYAQFMEGFPGAVIDEAKKRVWVDTSKDLLGALEKAYQKVLDADLKYFGVTEKYAAGFYEFLSQAPKAGLNAAAFLKGHVTGPISFGLSVTDEKKQSILYNNDLSEIIPKILAIKARDQIKKLKRIHDNVIIFIDEPYLVSLGSSVVNINRDDVTKKIGEVVSAVHQEGALAGIHCCGNTDWSLLMELGLDILNFDAYGYLKAISLYPDALKDFLKADKFLAWGIVPTSDEIDRETEDSLIKKLEEGFGYLIDKGIDKDLILDSLMVTPSCGCGTMSEKNTEKVLDLNVGVSDRLRAKYGK
ncbi:MAG: hypothetical protein HQ575_00260 [Candidatus Omnitrophica bacterium]|nr:hypothetical protein [Candidatus Omnitrophota bacterium]